MKGSEKTTDTTSATVTRSTQEPFFGKTGSGGFFQDTKQSNAPVIQAKLTVNEPGDQYEQEADRMADQVVQRLAMPAQEKQAPLLPATVSGAIQMKCEDCGQEEKIQRKEEESMESEEIQRKESTASPSADTGSDFSSRLQSSKGGGSPLSENTRADMESAFGADFSGVRIHTGNGAKDMSRHINAQAFTHGRDVYFNEGKFDGGSGEGRRLLAHELTHTMQQSTAIQPKRKPKAKDVNDDLTAGRVQEALGNKFVTDAFHDISDKSNNDQTKKEKRISLRAFKMLDEALGESVKGDLGLKGINKSEMSAEDIASMAFSYGMLAMRQTFIEKYTTLVYSSIDARPKVDEDTIKKIQELPFEVPDQEYIEEEPGQSIKEYIVQNPDLDAKNKGFLLKSVCPNLTEPERNNLLFGNENQSELRKKISEKAEFYYYALGGIGEMPDVFLASVGDKGGSSGLLKSPQRSISESTKDISVGTGYFMYEQDSFGNHINIEKITGEDKSERAANSLSIKLSAYGFDNVNMPGYKIQKGKVNAIFKIGDQAFTVTFEDGKITCNREYLPAGITVTSNDSTAYVNIPSTYRRNDVMIDIQHASHKADQQGVDSGDEIQLMIAANSVMNTAIGNTTVEGKNTDEKEHTKKVDKNNTFIAPLEAKELFESGNFVSKGISTLTNSGKTSEKELAEKIVAFSVNLNISKIIALLTLTDEKESEDFSQFFILQGSGISKSAPIPQSFKKENEGLSDTQLLDKMQKLDKSKLTKYYQIDSGYDEDVSYEMIIAILETYRSSEAKMSKDKIDISSTTDPQGTGINSGSNNDFPDYYNHYIKGTLFGNAVEEDRLLKMTGPVISRENNDILSALRSLSFLKLILEQKGLNESDFAKMNVKVFVGSKEEPANLGQVPTEFSVFYSEH